MTRADKHIHVKKNKNKNTLFFFFFFYMFKIIFPHRFDHHSLQQQKFCSLKSLRSDLFWVFTLFTRLLEIHFHYTLFTLSLSLFTVPFYGRLQTCILEYSFLASKTFSVC
ncbi:hypothetical protein ACOSQ3_019867 [Xanthoceras sorbifolium]